MQFYSRKIEKLALWSNVGIILGVFLPWLSFNVIATVSISGFSLTLGKILVGLSFINFFLAASIKRRTQALIDVIVAGVDFYLMYSTYTDIKTQMLGQFFLQVLPWQFGLYLTIISCLVLLATGIYRMVGDSTWWAYTLSNKLSFLQNKINPGAIETASTIDIPDDHANQVVRPPLDIRLLFQSGKAKAVLSLIIIFAIYLISIPIYNSMQTPNSTIQKFISAVKNNNSSELRSLAVDTENHMLTATAIQAYIDYYQKHLDELQNSIGSLDNENPLISGNNVDLVKHSTFGYTSYKVQLATTHLMANALKKTQLAVNQNKNTITATGFPQDLGMFVTGVPLNISATDKTLWGNVTETKQATPGNGTCTLQFSNNFITVDTTGLVPGAEIDIDGNDSGQKVIDGNVKLGPLPLDKTYIISTDTKKSFGDIQFAASAKINPSTFYGAINLSADQKSNQTVLTSLAHFLFKFTNTACSANGNVSTYTQTGSPAAGIYQNTYQGAPITFQKLTVYPKTLQMVQAGNDFGVRVQVVADGQEHDPFGNSSSSWGWIYTLIWDNSAQTWKIYNTEQQYFWFNLSGINDVTVTD